MKNNQFKSLLLVLIATALSQIASAYDFMVDGLCYNYNGDGTSVTVTYQGSGLDGWGYSNLSGELNIPASVTNNEITYSVTSIGYYAFAYCRGLTSVTIPNSVTSIGEGAFGACTGLASVTIPNLVTSIGHYAFYGCSGLTSVTIPNSVTSIGEYAFSDCSGLTSMVVESGNTKYDSRNNCNAIIETATNTLIYGCKTTVIPNSVTSIGVRAFEYCLGLTSVTIPNSVTSIGHYAFCYCTGLNSMTIGNSVTEIGAYAFYNCTGLTGELIIPNSVTSIGGFAFNGCSGLNSMTIGNSVTSIGDEAFYNCRGLTGELIIPNSVTSIGFSAFSGCSGLTSLSIGNSVTSIGVSAFSGCSGLNSMTIGNSVTSIAAGAFSHCRGLTSITIPNSVTSIGNDAFSGCTGLTSVTIPNSVTSIGDWAFEGCTGLTSVNISDLAAWCNIVFANHYANPLSYAHNFYLNGSKVTDLVIPNTVTEIKEYTFSNCTGLTSIIIPNSVTSIDGGAFDGCNGLETIIWNAKNCNAYFEYLDESSATSIFAKNKAGVALPNIKTFIFGKDVQKIPDGLCFHLNPDEIYVSRKGRPAAITSEDVFFNVDKDSCTLYVPAEYEQIYWASYGWSSFLNIVPWNPITEIAGGDANEDGAVNIGDYVSTASYILERNPQPFNFEAADIDGNGTINVVDLVCVADLALNYPPSTYQSPATVMSDAAIGMDAEIKERNNDCYEVIINLSNDLNITAMQMDLTLPEGMTLIDASLSDRADASHQVEFEHLNNGDYRLLASSSANKAFSSNDGTLLTLTIAGTPSSNSVLRNIILASPENTGYELDDIILSFETSGVDEINSITKIYCDDENIIIDSPVYGSAQIVLPNGMSQTVKVQAGHNVYPAPAKGLVIVKMNDNAVKLFR